jgi:hypothetical protein
MVKIQSSVYERAAIALHEAESLIPADLVTEEYITIRLKWRDGVSTFHYWTYVSD